MYANNMTAANLLIQDHISKKIMNRKDLGQIKHRQTNSCFDITNPVPAKQRAGAHKPYSPQISTNSENEILDSSIPYYNTARGRFIPRTRARHPGDYMRSHSGCLSNSLMRHRLFEYVPRTPDGTILDDSLYFSATYQPTVKTRQNPRPSTVPARFPSRQPSRQPVQKDNLNVPPDWSSVPKFRSGRLSTEERVLRPQTRA